MSEPKINNNVLQESLEELLSEHSFDTIKAINNATSQLLEKRDKAFDEHNEVIKDIKNDTVQRFWTDVRLKFQWCFLPLKTLHLLYLSWNKRFYPSVIPIKYDPFVDSLLKVITEDELWECEDPPKKQRIRKCFNMDVRDPLLDEYDVPCIIPALCKGITRINIGKDAVDDDGYSKIDNPPVKPISESQVTAVKSIELETEDEPEIEDESFEALMAKRDRDAGTGISVFETSSPADYIWN